MDNQVIKLIKKNQMKYSCQGHGYSAVLSGYMQKE